ncbi:hypothetical protein X777_06092, partial [Ooceraea biroi]
ASRSQLTQFGNLWLPVTVYLLHTSRYFKSLITSQMSGTRLEQLQRNKKNKRKNSGTIWMTTQFCIRKSTFLALRVLKERQNSIEFERKIKARLKNILRWTMKRENLYKGTLCNLENENKELKRRLNEMQQERDHAEAVNNAKEKDKLKIAEKHPAFMEKKEEKKKKRSLFKT